MPYRATAKMAIRKNERRQRWLEAASRLFGEHGYHATTVPMIVAGAASSTGSFYLEFRNKEDIFAAVLEALGMRVEELVEVAQAKADDALMQVWGAVTALCLFLAKNPLEARILIVESSGLSRRLETVRRNVLGRHVARMTGIMKAHPNAFAVAYPEVAAQCLIGAILESLHGWLDTDDAMRLPIEEIVRVTSEHSVRAIARVGHC